ncbi:hypothetical protein [Geomesophilobacter sediminis]|uniref:Rubrerythrin n=1 Tax=Geomesophilobacter sediminis TaxID=2798584 RepID=A0A8J7LY41_9BACT|nr:hypothetical protein [Geomesophilobacter sediminis]MBJ6724057.1 hypothetical protein [Geomesophilobacter sediminis]
MTEHQDSFKLSCDEESVLELCIEVEEACAELYRYFERVFDDDRELSELWGRTAREEDEHAEQFRVAARLKGVGVEGIRNEIYAVQALLQTVQDYLERDDAVPSPADALAFALEVEVSLAEFHMDSVLNFSDHHLEQVFLTHLKCDNTHVAQLQEALQRWKQN